MDFSQEKKTLHLIYLHYFIYISLMWIFDISVFLYWSLFMFMSRNFVPEYVHSNFLSILRSIPLFEVVSRQGNLWITRSKDFLC